MSYESILDIVLGTVQFGMDYGINNPNGKVAFQEVEKILHLAWEKGVHLLDTAPVYGSSEKVLGKILKQYSGKPFKIITKMPCIQKRNEITSLDINDAKKIFYHSIYHSINSIGQEKIEVLFVHHAGDLLARKSDSLFQILEGFKDEGLVSKLGVSVYEVEEARQVLKKYPFDIVSLPLSILDQRFLKNGFIKEIKSQGVEILVRSIFVQGLLFMDLKNLPLCFWVILDNLLNYASFKKERGIRSLEAVFRFIKGISQIDYVVMGVDSREHLERNLQAFHLAKGMDVEVFKEFAGKDDFISQIYSLLAEHQKLDFGLKD